MSYAPSPAVSGENIWRCVGLAHTKTREEYHLVVDRLPQIGQLIELPGEVSRFASNKSRKSLIVLVHPVVPLLGLM
jgi:hypothetical protein